MVGYPCDLTFDYSELIRFFRYSVNNLGDAFASSTYELSTKDFERDVLTAFSRWTHLPEQSLWGYVTNGGTEGNTHGLLLAREACANGVVFYSADTHYSVPKAIRLLNLPAVQVKSQPDGRIDLADLRRKVANHRWGTPILLANIGTTMKGAIDDVPGMRQVMEDVGRRKHYIHADAAFSGMILPFVDDPEPWDFAAGIDSLSISGHKLIGSPIPCGVLLARRGLPQAGRVIEYVATTDTTLSGSRNGLTPLILWYALRSLGEAGLRRRVEYGLDLADYLIDGLEARGVRAWRHRNSLTVVFDRPGDEVARKWQIPVHGDVAHVCTLSHITREQLDVLIDDLTADVGAPHQEFESTVFFRAAETRSEKQRIGG
jgi:histidine decarboxylase